MPMETLSEALQRLKAAGYADDYQAEGGGLRDRASGVLRQPEAFHVDEVVRFEGESDPSEESAIFALSDGGDGAKGTYTVGFGALMDSLDAEFVARLGAWPPTNR